MTTYRRPLLDNSIPEFDGADLAQVTEDSLALEFAEEHKNDLRYCAPWGTWLRYDRSHWRKENTLQAYDFARQICRNAASTALKQSVKSKLSESHTVSAVVRLASSDRVFATTPEQWNSEPHKLNTTNGTIDLKTGRLLRHNPDDLYSKVTGTAYTDGTPDVWLRYLDRVTGSDSQLLAYLQRVFGYCLTGMTCEHALFVLYGTGSNGKSVWTDTLGGILGDYARSTPTEVFVETKSEQHPTAIAGLQSVRLAFSAETGKGARWNEAKIKSLTGGDRITARYMRQDYFEFNPEFKLMIATNHKPRLTSVDEAIRRRLHLIPFTVTIPPDERDLHLTEKLKTEWPAILAWAVQGCLEWQKQGLNPPKAVMDATNEYLSSEDKLGLWLAARCELNRSFSAGVTAAFNDYKRWCEEMNEQPGSQRTFSQELYSRQGITPDHSRTGNLFVGIGLKSDLPEQP